MAENQVPFDLGLADIINDSPRGRLLIKKHELEVRARGMAAELRRKLMQDPGEETGQHRDDFNREHDEIVRQIADVDAQIRACERDPDASGELTLEQGRVCR